MAASHLLLTRATSTARGDNSHTTSLARTSHQPTRPSGGGCWIRRDKARSPGRGPAPRAANDSASSDTTSATQTAIIDLTPCVQVVESEITNPDPCNGNQSVPAMSGTARRGQCPAAIERDRKSTRLNSSHANISYAVFCLKKKTQSGTTT